MAKPAQRVSLLFEVHRIDHLPDTFGQVLATHLLGTPVSVGARVALPGWPTALVDACEPNDAVVEPGTEVEVYIPPPTAPGPLDLVAVVDASLTMGKGTPSRFERIAETLDSFLLNGREFLAQAGIVVQGGATRHADRLRPVEDVAGASILKVTPKGTFDLAGGLAKATELLEERPQGPGVVLVLTDGGSAPKDALAAARPVLRSGAKLVILSLEPHAGLDELARVADGLATNDPGLAFAYLGELAGSKAHWVPPAPGYVPQQAYEFEVVIEALED